MRPAPFERRIAGLLVPAYALRHDADFGIGDTLAVRDAVDFCAEHNLALLQLLPIHECVGDYSPYNPISSRALSPALIALSEREVPGLRAEDVDRLIPGDVLRDLRGGYIRYADVQARKLRVLFASHAHFIAQTKRDPTLGREFAAFRRASQAWLPLYTLFRVLVREHGDNPDWTAWPAPCKEPAAAQRWLDTHPRAAELRTEREALAYVQWVAWRQWMQVRTHADARGVFLMGEMSFGVGRASADVWAWRELFDLDGSVGTPPISYFDTDPDSVRWGQNWGLPAYRWENHRNTGFRWLRERVEAERQFFHACRLDHLRGYFRAYVFPWPGGETHAQFAGLDADAAAARTGGILPRYFPGPDDDADARGANERQGREIIAVLREAAGPMVLVAELMGAMPDYMRRALEDLALPNLSFPQLERQPDRSLTPAHALRELSLVAYGNHDHAPIATWYERLASEAACDPSGAAAIDLANLLVFIGWRAVPPPRLTTELLAAFQRALLATPCRVAVLMSSDLLGTSLRFNLPGTHGAGTWSERLALSLRAYAADASYGPRIATVQRLIRECGRDESTDASAIDYAGATLHGGAR